MPNIAYPEPTVGALIFDQQSRILLLKCKKHKNRYVIPGGHVEIGEKMHDAVYREVKEETGLDIYDVEILAIQDSIFNKFYHKRKHFIYIDFSCKTGSDDVKINEESEEFLWITPQESLSLPLDPYTERLIQEYLKGKKSKYRKNVIYGYKEL